MRFAPFAVLPLTAALLGCGSGDGPGDQPPALGGASARAEAAENGIAYCALAGADEFAPDCRIDRVRGRDGLVLTLRHPDGGFRRVLVTGDGRGVIAADGAEPAIVTPVSDREIEIAIAADRYRLPATVR